MLHTSGWKLPLYVQQALANMLLVDSVVLQKDQPARLLPLAAAVLLDNVADGQLLAQLQVQVTKKSFDESTLLFNLVWARRGRQGADVPASTPTAGKLLNSQLRSFLFNNAGVTNFNAALISGAIESLGQPVYQEIISLVDKVSTFDVAKTILSPSELNMFSQIWSGDACYAMLGMLAQ